MRLAYWRWLFVVTLFIVIWAYFIGTIMREKPVLLLGLAFITFAFFVIFRLGLGQSSEASTGRKSETIIKNGKEQYPKFIPWSILPILFVALWASNVRLFGRFDVAAIFFHLSHSLKYDGIAADIAEFLTLIFLGIISVLCLVYLGRRDRRIRILDKVMSAAILLFNPLTAYGVEKIIGAQNADQLSQDYIDVQLVHPENLKPNLLLIYLESMEASFDDPRFGDAFDEMGDVENRGLTVNGAVQAEATGWTIAGIVASQCGIPLFSYGLVRKNKFEDIDTMLPGATCLGDVLAKNGYENIFVGGTNIKFAGKDKFFKTHGFSQAFGIKSFPENERTINGRWGVSDRLMFNFAMKELRRLNKEKKPYFLSALTLAAHTPDGVPGPECYTEIPNAQEMETMLLGVKCTGLNTRKFLTQARSEGLLENTLVVVMSDHFMMKSALDKRLTDMNRENLLVFLGEKLNPGAITRSSATFDVYPTILSLMGFVLPDEGAALGRDLLSTTPTLIETYGKKRLDRMIISDKKLRQKVWELDP